MLDLTENKDIALLKHKIRLILIGLLFIVLFFESVLTFIPKDLLGSALYVAIAIIIFTLILIALFIGLYVKPNSKKMIKLAIVVFSFIFILGIISLLLTTPTILTENYSYFLVGIYIFLLRDIATILYKWKLNKNKLSEILSQPYIWLNLCIYSFYMTVVILLVAGLFNEKILLIIQQLNNVIITIIIIILITIPYIFADFTKESTIIQVNNFKNNEEIIR